jgi:hypothetical protein
MSGDNNGLRKDVREAIERQVAEVPIEGAPFSFQFIADHEPADEAEGLAMAAEYITNFGMMIAQAGMGLATAMMSCPRMDEPTADDLIAHMREIVHGAAEDAPVPVTILAYMGRAVTNDRILENRPEVEELLKILEEWARGLNKPTFANLRALYSHALQLTTHDVKVTTDMLKAIQRKGEG